MTVVPKLPKKEYDDASRKTKRQHHQSSGGKRRQCCAKKSVTSSTNAGRVKKNEVGAAERKEQNEYVLYVRQNKTEGLCEHELRTRASQTYRSLNIYIYRNLKMPEIVRPIYYIYIIS